MFASPAGSRYGILSVASSTQQFLSRRSAAEQDGTGTCWLQLPLQFTIQMENLTLPCLLLQIVVGRAHTVDGQMDLLMTVGAKMVEEPYKLLVVDSIMALFR